MTQGEGEEPRSVEWLFSISSGYEAGDQRKIKDSGQARHTRTDIPAGKTADPQKMGGGERESYLLREGRAVKRRKSG